MKFFEKKMKNINKNKPLHIAIYVFSWCIEQTSPHQIRFWFSPSDPPCASQGSSANIWHTTLGNVLQRGLLNVTGKKGQKFWWLGEHGSLVRQKTSDFPKDFFTSATLLDSYQPEMYVICDPLTFCNLFHIADKQYSAKGMPVTRCRHRVGTAWHRVLGKLVYPERGGTPGRFFLCTILWITRAEM